MVIEVEEGGREDVVIEVEKGGGAFVTLALILCAKQSNTVIEIKLILRGSRFIL